MFTVALQSVSHFEKVLSKSVISKCNICTEEDRSSVFSKNFSKENYHVKIEEKLGDGTVYSHGIGERRLGARG